MRYLTENINAASTMGQRNSVPLTSKIANISHTHTSESLDDLSTHGLLAVTGPVLPNQLLELPSFWPKIFSP